MQNGTLDMEMHFAGVEPDAAVQRHLDRGIAKLDTYTKKFPTRAGKLSIEHRERDGVYSVNLVLELPNRTIAAHDMAPHLLGAVDRTFRRATRQVREFKSLLRRDHLHRHTREVLDALPGISEADVSDVVKRHDLDEFRRMAQAHMGRVRRFMREELRALRSRVPWFRGSIDDLVDETMARAFETFDRKPWAQGPDRWLYSVALDILEEQIQSARREPVTEEGVLDPDMAEVPPDEAQELVRQYLTDVEALDELDPVNEDGMDRASQADDPAMLAEQHDLESWIGRLIAELPRSWRRAFLLHFVEGFDLQEVAQIQNLSEESVRMNVHSAELFLRERLGEVQRLG